MRSFTTLSGAFAAMLIAGIGCNTVGHSHLAEDQGDANGRPSSLALTIDPCPGSDPASPFEITSTTPTSAAPRDEVNLTLKGVTATTSIFFGDPAAGDFFSTIAGVKSVDCAADGTSTVKVMVPETVSKAQNVVAATANGVIRAAPFSLTLPSDKLLAVNDVATVMEGESIVLHPLENDVIPNGAEVSLEIIGGAEAGGVQVGGDNTLTVVAPAYDQLPVVPVSGTQGSSEGQMEEIHYLLLRYRITTAEKISSEAQIFVEVTKIPGSPALTVKGTYCPWNLKITYTAALIGPFSKMSPSWEIKAERKAGLAFDQVGIGEQVSPISGLGASITWGSSQYEGASLPCTGFLAEGQKFGVKTVSAGFGIGVTISYFWWEENGDLGKKIGWRGHLLTDNTVVGTTLFSNGYAKIVRVVTNQQPGENPTDPTQAQAFAGGEAAGKEGFKQGVSQLCSWNGGNCGISGAGNYFCADQSTKSGLPGDLSRSDDLKTNFYGGCRRSIDELCRTLPWIQCGG